MNDVAVPISHVVVDPITVEVIGSALSSITEEMGEALIRASLFHQHQGTPRLLHRAVRRPRQHAMPGRAHPDASRQLHRPDPAHHEAASAWSRCVQATCSAATTPMRAAARICPTSCWPNRSSSKASIIAWAVNLAHHADFADRGHAHIYQEGLRIPPIRLYRAGELQTRRAGADPAELPGAARAPVRSARADGGEPAGRAAHAGAVREVRPRHRAGRRRRAAGLRRAQDARRHRRDTRRHLSFRRSVRLPGDRRRARSVLRDHGRWRRDARCTSKVRRRCAPAST